MRLTKTISAFALTALIGGLAASPLAANAADNKLPGKGKTIHMARATWDTGWWQTEVYTQLLEKLGYKVTKPTTLQNPLFYQSVAQGDVDMWVNGWFPLHDTYKKVFSHGAQVVGYVAKGGALQGYLIDKKTADKYDINYVSDLTKPKIQKLFDTNGDGKANMVGCPPGWGCEKMISYQMKAYGWDKHFDVIKAGYSASMADALGRYKSGKPIFFYTWTPNWTVGVLKPGKDVVWLQVHKTMLPKDQADLSHATKVNHLTGCRGPNPCNLGWPANDIRPVVNTAFLKKNPAVKSLLMHVRIPIKDIFKENAEMNAGHNSAKDLAKQASDWIAAHQTEVNGWLKDARQAATS